MIDTPLGVVATYVRLGQWQSNCADATISRSSPKSQRLSWQTVDADVELTVCDVQASESSRVASVDGFRAALWKVSANRAVNEFCLDLELRAIGALPTVDWDVGEGLSALSVVNDSQILLLGGSDTAQLAWMAQSGGVPSRWEQLLQPYNPDSPYFVQRNGASLSWIMPELFSGEQFELALAAAWGKPEHYERIWSAILVTPDWIRAIANS